MQILTSHIFLGVALSLGVRKLSELGLLSEDGNDVESCLDLLLGHVLVSVS